MPISRRAFLRGATRVGVAATVPGAGLYVYARKIEPAWLDVTLHEVRLPRLPDVFAGFTIVQISDLHFGAYLQSEHLQPVIDAVNALDADAIVITGDLVSRVTHGETDMIAETLPRFRAKEGVFTIMGNHDWWHGNGPPVEDAMRRAGMPLLSNRHITWRRGASTLHLAGVDDVWVGRDRLDDAMHGIPADAAVVLLAHEPDFADTAALDPRIGLQLSGHSHGGQVRIPYFGAYWYPELCRKYPEGRYQIGDMALYTNRGIGVVTLPVRFCCRPEITKFTLLPRG